MAPSAPGKGASTDQRLDYLTKLVESVVLQGSETRSLLEETRSLLTQEKAKVSALETVVGDLTKELRTLQDTVNSREQSSRSLMLRIVGLPSSEDEVNSPDPDKFLAKKIYETILQPILTGAKSKSLIKSVPTLSNTILKAYRVGKFGPKPSPSSPIIVTLTDPSIKVAIFKAKKQFLPLPSEPGAKRYLLAEDLTFPTFSKLKELRDHKDVDRAWTVEGRIRYTLLEDKDKFVHKLPSSYSDVSSLPIK